MTLLDRIELVPGRFWVSIHDHSLETMGGRIACWTYVSEGLSTFRQKEIVLTVKREPGEASANYDRSVLQLYAAIYRAAAAGRIVDVGDETRLGEGSPLLLGRADFRCIAYARPIALDGVELPSPRLTAVVVTCRELDVAARLGSTRLLGRLGASTRYFPYPPWVDRRRAEMIAPAEVENSLLGKTASLHLPGIFALLERSGAAPVSGSHGFFAPSDRIVLRISASGAEALKKAMAAKQSDQGLLALLEVDPSSDSCFIWQPGQTKPTAISMPQAKGERISANFLLLTAGSPQMQVVPFERWQ